jgi:hypothetical protein
MNIMLQMIICIMICANVHAGGWLLPGCPLTKCLFVNSMWLYALQDQTTPTQGAKPCAAAARAGTVHGYSTAIAAC